MKIFFLLSKLVFPTCNVCLSSLYHSSDGHGSPLATPPNLTRKISFRSPCFWCDFGLAPVSLHFFQTGSSKVNKVFQMQLLRYWVGGHNNFHQSADPTPPLSIHYSFWLMRTEHWYFCVKLCSFSVQLLLSQLFPGCTHSWRFFSPLLQNFAVLITKFLKVSAGSSHKIYHGPTELNFYLFSTVWKCGESAIFCNPKENWIISVQALTLGLFICNQLPIKYQATNCYLFSLLVQPTFNSSKNLFIQPVFS